jgi:hypothetical protein
VWAELGRAYLEYAESGLVDASRARAEASQALEHFCHAAALDQQDGMAREGLRALRERFGLATVPLENDAGGDRALIPQGADDAP